MEERGRNGPLRPLPLLSLRRHFWWWELFRWTLRVFCRVQEAVGYRGGRYQQRARKQQKERKRRGLEGGICAGVRAERDMYCRGVTP